MSRRESIPNVPSSTTTVYIQNVLAAHGAERIVTIPGRSRSPSAYRRAMRRFASK
jgi:hypothetical protein